VEEKLVQLSALSCHLYRRCAQLDALSLNIYTTIALATTNDRVLKAFIHNLTKPPIPTICGYLQEARFLHASRMLEGCKLDPRLISALDFCTTLLGKVPNNFNSGWISMNWLAKKFDKLLVDATEVVKVATTPSRLQRMQKTKFRISRVGHIIPRAFGWTQQIPPLLQDLKELHKVGMHGKNDENWQELHKEYIEAWDHRMNFLPICEPFFLADTVACLEYLPWFRLASKLYLLLLKARSKKKQRRLPQQQRRARCSRTAAPYYAPPLHVAGFSVSVGTYFGPPKPLAFYTLMSTQMSGQMLTHALSPMTTLMQMPMLMLMPWLMSIGSSTQPSAGGVEDTRWEARTTLHSSTLEGDGEEEDEYEYEQEDEDQYQHREETHYEHNDNGGDRD
ncbi:hypothetical protein Goklo_001144, partial [Gossypium klotzschianum]|nr:hypothetical protein [Gossypium klotzschianum]